MAENISGGGSGGYGLIGGIIGSIHDGVFDWVNLGENRRIQRQNLENARSQIALQREFAQNSIQWRVADAKKAGIHPLAALGAQGTSYTPMDMSQSPVNYRTNRGMEMAAYFSNLETQKLQNKLLETQIETQILENQARQKELDTPAGQSSATVVLPPKKKSSEVSKNLAPRHLPESQNYKNPLNLTDDEQSQITTETMSQGGSIFSSLFDKFYRDHVDRKNGIISEDEAYSFAERYLYGKYKVIPKGVNLHELAKMLYDKAKEAYYTRDRKSSHRSNRPDVDLYMQNWGY